jgi:glucose/arabinose dehydrogenase
MFGGAWASDGIFGKVSLQFKLMPRNRTLRFGGHSALLVLFTFCALTGWGQTAPAAIVGDRLIAAEWPVSVRPASHAAGESNLLIVCHSGLVMWYDEANDVIRDEPFLDLSATGLDIVDYGIMSEQGLNDLILDPNFEENGLFYVIYNGHRPDGTGTFIDERLLCFGTNADRTQADPNTWFEVLELVQPARGHNGGQLHFGPLDGYLYISTGDGGGTGTGETGGGSGGDDHGPIGNGQNLQTLLGKLLRIEVHGLAPYTVPESNPFVGNDEALNEIWAYGFRNPWRWSFDRLTGDKFIGDVGEVDWEEVSMEAADSEGGLNFGWRLMEGPMCYEPVVDCDPDGNLELPIFSYPHDNGWCSVIGGYRYRGSEIPTLYGSYIFTDACGFYDVKFWSLTEQADGSWLDAPLDIQVPDGFVPWDETRFAFSENNEGELYLCTRLNVYKLVYDPADQQGGGDLADVLRFTPNPVLAGSDVVLDVGSLEYLTRLRITEASGRLVHDVELSAVQTPYTWNTAGMTAGTYVIEAWTAADPAPIRGKLSVIQP